MRHLMNHPWARRIKLAGLIAALTSCLVVLPRSGGATADPQAGPKYPAVAGPQASPNLAIDPYGRVIDITFPQELAVTAPWDRFRFDLNMVRPLARDAGAFLGDLTGDSLPDLLMPSFTGEILFFPGVGGGPTRFGTGSYLKHTQSSPADNPFAFGSALWLQGDVGDLDGDGVNDVAVGQSAGYGGVDLYRNVGTGTEPLLEHVYTFPGGSWDSSASIGDLNADGKPDVVITFNYVGGNTYIYWNNSTPGNFSFTQQALNNPNHSPSQHLALGDINGDGLLDLVCPAGIYLNSGTPQVPVFDFVLSGWNKTGGPDWLATSDQPPHVVLRDGDGDGLLDAYVSNLSTTLWQALFYRNVGTATTHSLVYVGPVVCDASPTNAYYHGQTGPSFGGSRALVATGDIDNNGLADVLLTPDQSLLGGYPTVLWNYPTEGGPPGHTLGYQDLYTYPSLDRINASCGSSPDAACGPPHIFAGWRDVTGDAAADALRLDENNSFRLYKQVRSGTFPFTLGPDIAVTTPSGGQAAVLGVAWVDVDLDNRLDLIGGGSGGQLGWFRNIATDGSFMAGNPALLTDASGAAIDVGSQAWPAAIDLDGDLDLDFLVSNYDGYVYKVFCVTPGSQQGYALGPRLGTPQQDPLDLADVVGGTLTAPTLTTIDVNADGKPDVVVGDASGRVWLLRNVGAGGTASFVLEPLLISRTQAAYLEVVDPHTVRLRFALPAAIGSTRLAFHNVPTAEGPVSGEVTILPSLSVNDVMVIEGQAGTTTANFTVSLSPPVNQTVSVDWSTSDGSATAGQDYLPASGTLTFNPNETSKTIPITVLGDSLYEPDETFTLNLNTAVGAAIVDGQGLGTILNDEIAFAIDDVTHNEGNSGTTAYTFTVTKTGITTSNCSVNFTTVDGTATTVDNDYQAQSGTLTFLSTDTTKTIIVLVNGDTTFEPDETFTVHLSGASGATIADADGTGTISNDESVPAFAINNVTHNEGNAATTSYTFTVTKTGSTVLNSSVNFTTVDGTATIADNDYQANSGTLSFLPADASKTITVLVNGDPKIEPDEVFTVHLSGASDATIADADGTGTIVNDDLPTFAVDDVAHAEGNAGTTSYTFTVTKTGDTALTAAVNFNTVNGTATTADNDYQSLSGTLTFLAADTTKTITVLVNGDAMFELDEAFTVHLSGASGATISDADGTGAITNDDGPPAFAIDDVTHNEGNAGTTAYAFTVTKTGSTALSSSVNFSTVDGTATTANNDYQAQSGALTFLPADTTKTITVLVNGDIAFEPDETFTVHLSGASGATIADPDGTGTIANEDVSTPPTLGYYPDTAVQAGANTTVTPDGVPTNTTRMNASTASAFRGAFTANPTTGVVMVTNAQPAGTYTVTVTAFTSADVTATKTFTLTVTNATLCNSLSFSGASGSPFAVGTNPYSVTVGDFNGDGKQDLATANYNSNSVTVLLGNGSGSFSEATGSPLAVGTNPSSAVVGDFNGDGKQDLATANYGTSNVTVLLGNGSGGFSPASASPFAVGTHPSSVAVADFNGDGKQDLATANLSSDNVTILLGNGSGGFTPASGSPFAVGSNPDSVAVSDFNRDGKLDLAIAISPSPASVTVLLGDGSGGFSPATGSPFVLGGTNPHCVAAGDFNGDGNPDLTTANYLSNSVTVLLGDGSGGFSPVTGSPFAVGARPNCVAVGDFNGDGSQDLTTANVNSNSLTVLLGNGSGGFSPATGSPFAVSGSPYFVAVGDFNSDGKLDLSTANFSSNKSTVLLNTCVSNTAPTISAVGVTREEGSPSADSTIANVNDLEDLETGLSVTVNGGASVTVNGVTVSGIGVSAAGVVTANVVGSCTATTATFTLRVTDTGGLFNEATLTVTVNANTAPTLTYDSPQAVVFGGALNVTPTASSDNGTVTGYAVQAGHGLTTEPMVDSSGVVSITNAQPSGAHTITIRATDNCGVFTDATFSLEVQPQPPTLGTYPNTTLALGANTTVTPDAAPTNASSISVASSTNFRGTFSADPATGVVRVTNAHPAGTYTVTITAFNGLVLNTTKTFTLTVQTGTACAGASIFTNAADSSVGTNPFSVAIGDFNSDGKQDIAVANYNSNTVSIRLGDGAGGFSGTTNVSVGFTPISVAIGDFNNDGKQDIAASNDNSSTVSIRLGDGLGGFTGTTNVSVGHAPRSVAIGDFNGDGKQDFAAGNYDSNTVSIRLGDGSGGFTAATDVSVGSPPFSLLSVAIGDFNNDGKQDIAVAASTVSIRLGDGLGGFSGTTNVSVGSNPQSVAIGDFNNDGNQDIAAANSGSATVSIRLGDGLGGFSGTTEVSVGTFPRSVEIGDFNNDGKQDIAVANASASSNSVSIRLGDGSGGFTGTTNVSTGSNPYSAAIGDFNGDGQQDFATANQGSNNVSILLGHCNLQPTIVAATGLSRQQGSPASNSQIATVTDDGGNGSVIVTVTSANPSNGVTISNIVNTAGNITADIVADCTATTATFTLQASDGSSTTTDTLSVTVAANTAPTLTYSSPQAVVFGGALNVSPAAASDNGTITGYAVQAGHGLTTPPTVDSSGVVSITNAQPPGEHTITIRATDNCGAFTDAAFTLNVGEMPTFTIDDLTHNEGNSSTTAFIFTVTKNGSTAVSLSVDFTTVDGTATTADNDYQALAGSFIFLPTDTTKTITVLVNGDTMFELDETFTVHLSGATFGAGLHRPSGSVGGLGTITNDDNAPTFSINDVTHNEGNSGTTAFIFAVTKTGSTALNSSVDFATVNGSATTADNDYQANSGTLNFLPTDTTKTITVLVNGDTTFESEEAFTVQLSGASGGTIAAGLHPLKTSLGGTGTITNDDSAPSFAIDDVTQVETNSGATSFVFTVTKTGSTALNSSVNFATADGTATTANNDYQANSDSLTFLPTDTTKQITVLVNGDTTFEANEAFTVHLSGASGATISDADGAGTIVNDDSFPTFTIDDVTHNEGNSSTTAFVFTVTKTGATALNSSVNFTTADGTATTATGDYQFNADVLAFSPIEMTKTITVLVNGDTTVEPDEAFTVHLSAASGATIADADGTGTITNDDVAAPTLGNYPNTTVQAGANTTVIPDAAPTSTARMNVSTSSAFKGTFAASPTTGVIQVTDGQPAGTYNVTVMAFNADGVTTTKTFTLTVTNPTQCVNATFSGSSPFDVGPYPYSVAVGDFNGDGKQDLATANYSSNDVTVLLGNGSGGFSAASGSPFAAGTNPISVAVGDFNGDGKQDLAIANSGSNNVTVLLGSGSGGFSAAGGSPFAVGTNPFRVAVGDFDGDGKLDLATANRLSNNATVLLGDGSGGFSPAAGSPFTVGTDPRCIAVGDFNGDGKLDLTTSNFNSYNLTVLLGNGAGGFTEAGGSPVALPGADAYSVAVGDVNNDGKLDLMTANVNLNNTMVLLGNGSGGFSPAPGSPFSVGTNPFSVTMGDFNGDGKQDLATGNYWSHNVTVLLGNGSGSFSPAAGSPFAVGLNPISVVVGDFNGDAKLDLATANNGSSSVMVLLNTCAVNSTPTISAVGVTRQQGSPSANATIANVNDLEDPETALTVTVNGGASATVNGVTVSGISVSASGVVTADVIANCTATTATFALRVTDTSGLFNEATLTVTVDANTAPTLTYASPQAVVFGGALNVTPTAASDNGSVTYSVQPGHGLATEPTVDSTGVVSITNAQPSGEHSLTIRATDNCGAFTDAAFTLNVGDLPTFTIDDVTHNEGNSGTTAFIFTVTKNGSSAVTLSLDFTTVDETATTADNDYQALSGTLTFLPTDTIKTITVLGNGDTTLEPDETFTVHLAGATFGSGLKAPSTAVGGTGTIINDDVAAPTLGNYPNTTVQAGANTTVTPDAAPINTTSINVSTSSAFRGTFTASPTTGVVHVTNAQPAGTYAVTVTAFNSAGVTTTKTFTLTVNNPAQCDLLSFGASSGSPFSVGSNPYSVAVGDFNGDGKQDLATANSGSNNVTVLLGNGSGSFTAASGSPFAVGSFPSSVVVGDFNGDGKLDLATANYSWHNVSVLLGDGGGGFSEATGSPFAVGTQPYQVAVGDFNGDGKLDLAIANRISNNVTVLLGNGDGGFTPASGSPFVVGTDPRSVGVGDFNGDGKLDLTTANFNTNNVTVLLGDGSGGFSEAGGSPFGVGTSPRSVAVADLNQDGKLDLTIANENSSNATVLLGDGSGGFTPASGSPFTVGGAPSSVACADFNGDGKLDLATANLAPNDVTVLLGDGSGGFSAASGSPFAVGSSPYLVAVGDFNSDGKLDLTTANQGSSNVTVLLNTCTANTAPTITAVGVTRQQGSPSANATIANVNDLGDPDTALSVTVNGSASATVNSVTVSGISVSAAGVVTADVVASCTATTATFTLRVTDTGGLFNEATLTVTIDANTSPTLTYSSPQSVIFGGALNVTPTAASDNGSVTYSVLAGHSLTTAPTVDTSGVVSITNAQASGAHTITIRATDNCGAFTDAAFTLNVGAMPAFTIDDVTHNEGDVGTLSYTFTVTKTGSTALNSSVNFTTVDGTATTANNDYQLNSGALNFLATDTTKQITVLVICDTAVESDEAFTVHLAGASSATITDADGTGAIINDDCSVSMSSDTENFTAAGGAGSVTLTTTSACTWTAVSNDPSFITITSGSSGSGNGTVNYSVAVNTGPVRTGTMTIAGHTFTVTQDSGCTYLLGSMNQNFVAAGGTNSVNVITSPGCPWTALSNNAFITVNSGTPGSGNGTVNYSVAANLGPARTGTMTIAGITFTVTQDSGCTFTLTRDHESFPGNGGSGTVNVTASDPGCAWTASTTSIFVTITSGSSGSGSGVVEYTVAANSGSTIRSDTITVAGQTFTVYQGINFADVPANYLFYDDIGKLAARGVTVGCGGGNYCPNDPVTREQMAAFILRAKGEFDPPTPPGQRFNDVPPTNVFYSFIDRLAELQITVGCTPDHLLYCPADPVKREQMAAFILRGMGEFDPPTPPSQRFDDVPPGNVFYSFIDRLAVLQITLGCTPDHVMYCPGDSVTRAQMAAFLVRAFNL